MQTPRGKAQDQRRLSKKELEASVTFKHESILLAFAVNMTVEIFKATVTTLLGRRFYKRLENEAARKKNLPLGYAYNVLRK